MKYTGIIVLLLLFAACNTETGYRVRGYFEGAPEGTVVYLGADSTKIVNGEFVFKGKTEAPELRELKVNALNQYGYPDFHGTLVWIGNEDLRVECPWEKLQNVYVYTEAMRISGSELNDVYGGYRKQAKDIGASRDSLWDVYYESYLGPMFGGTEVDRETGIQAMRAMQEIIARKRQLAREFVAAHPASPAAMEILAGQLNGQNYTVEEARQMIGGLDPALKGIPAYRKLMQAYEEFRPTAKGEKYMDVTLTDEEGKEVKLSEVIQPGKYTMLEFWASWCSPCRGEIPHLRHVNEVCGQDFDIISISIDEKEEAWKKAVAEEKMVWKQLRDAKGWKGGAARAYRVTGVPYSLLLDGEGRIVAGDLRGAELDIILAELLPERAKHL